MPKLEINVPAKKQSPAKDATNQAVKKAVEEKKIIIPNDAATKAWREMDEQHRQECRIRVEQIQWFDDHFYKIQLPSGEEVYYPSVTTVLGLIQNSSIMRWRADVGNEEADRRLHDAGRRGSRIHAATEVIESGGTIVFNDYRRPTYTRQELIEMEKNGEIMVLEEQEEMLQVIKYKRWLDAVQPECVALETIVADPDIESAGTLDRVYHIKGGKYEIAGAKPLDVIEGLYVIDIKSLSSIDPKFFKQISTYAKMYAKMYNVEFEGGMIVHTNADTKNGIMGLTTKMINPHEMDEYYQDYLDIYKVWKRNNPTKHPKVFTFPSLLTLQTKV